MLEEYATNNGSRMPLNARLIKFANSNSNISLFPRIQLKPILNCSANFFVDLARIDSSSSKLISPINSAPKKNVAASYIIGNPAPNKAIIMPPKPKPAT